MFNQSDYTSCQIGGCMSSQGVIERKVIIIGSGFDGTWAQNVYRGFSFAYVNLAKNFKAADHVIV